MSAPQIHALLSGTRFPLSDEKQTQSAIEELLKQKDIFFHREMELDKQNRPDFMAGTVAIEVKIKGSARAIYRQCERYCSFDLVSDLILVTGRAMGFPEKINGKNCYVVNIGRAWL